MDKLLVLGVNTRALINSALRLNYQTYSSSYYSTADSPIAYKEKHALQQKPYKSCGFFEDRFSFVEILNNGHDWIEIVDHIIFTTGISPNYFNGNIELKGNEDVFNISELNHVLKRNKKKIIGNKDTENVENKYKFYKKMKNRYPLPLTFKLYDISDALDILKQYDKKEFILKDINGSGGYGIYFLNTESNFQFEHMYELDEEYGKEKEFILQEYVPGDSLSCSVLGTKDNTKTIVGSVNINNCHYQTNGNKKDFRYSGNITPISQSSHGISILKEIYNMSEDLINDLDLIGSNGVDLVLKDDKINIIEVNPRFQGTYECVEEVLGINLLEAHIKACNGDLIDIPSPKNYAMKRIIYAPKKMIFNKSNLQNLNKKSMSIFDIPHENTIIEKDQPVLTLIGRGNKINVLKGDIEKTGNDINRTFG
ncbi:MAG: ATP-grasp domain-containing protein [Methanobrevibacter sp.]|jgi:predicted ATP-grasp superfamily ATP-dependent carboligase|nr:ATP-grasp domain-containing protein [Candidatus Methanovirga aequatorialis]